MASISATASAWRHLVALLACRIAWDSTVKCRFVSGRAYGAARRLRLLPLKLPHFGRTYPFTPLPVNLTEAAGKSADTYWAHAPAHTSRLLNDQVTIMVGGTARIARNPSAPQLRTTLLSTLHAHPNAHVSPSSQHLAKRRQSDPVRRWTPWALA